MNKFYLLYVSILSLSYSFAQTVEIVRTSDPSVDISGTEIEVIGTDSDIAVYSNLKVINKTGSAMNMAFKRQRLIDSGQADQICDNQGCFNATDTYEWSTSPVEILDGDTSLFKPQIVPNGNDFCGLNKYYVIDDQGIVYDSITIKIRTSKKNCFLNIKDESINKSNFEIYPNPAKNILNIETVGDTKVMFIDALGKQVDEFEINVGSNKLDISSLKNGVYFVSVISAEGIRSKPSKLIVQK